MFFSPVTAHTGYREQNRGQALPGFSLYCRQSNRSDIHFNSCILSKIIPFLSSLPLQLLVLHSPEVFFKIIEKDKYTIVWH